MAGNHNVGTVSIYIVRAVVGVASIVAALVVGSIGSDPALQFAVLFFGGFVLLHTVLDLVFRELILETASPDSNPTDGLRTTIGALIATPATVLGLVAVFGTNIATVVQVGAVALVAGIVLSAMLSMFVVVPVNAKPGTMNFISSLLQLSLWANVFGLACIGAGIVYR
jgi:hypothetical protein